MTKISGYPSPDRFLGASIPHLNWQGVGIRCSIDLMYVIRNRDMHCKGPSQEILSIAAR